MKTLILIILLLIPFVSHAAGPSMPDGYRMPNEEELSLPERNSNKYRYSMAAGDFNGDGLADGALLAIDHNRSELAVFVFLRTSQAQVFKWYKIGSFDYQSIKYTGVRLLRPQTILFYCDVRDEIKTELIIVNDAFELFQFEGPSSVFYYEPESDRFNRVWISK